MAGTESTIKVQTRNQLNIDTEVSRIFVFNNQTRSGNYVNTEGVAVSLKEGTLMGVIAATGKLQVMKPGAGDGSELPAGVLMGDVDVAIGGNADVNIVVSGDVVEERLIFFDGVSTLATLVGGVPYRELIVSNTVGIHLVSQGDQLTNFDNS